ncbi:MAG: TAT-variant-translocated molybdopterin oxidoreductase [Polyangiales bacterium]
MSRRKPYEFQEPAAGAPRVWRSLEEKDADPAVLRELAESEKPGGFLDVKSVTSRRGFLQVSAVTAAAVALEGCIRRPVENILPYSQGPEYLVPGVPLHFATVTSRGGDALGLLVTAHEGRPTKVEGNPEHPSSLGATDLRAQAFIADLYDSDRAHQPSKKNGNAHSEVSQDEFDREFQALVDRHRARGGRGLRFLAQPTNSPSFIRLRDQILRAAPEAKFHTYASVHDSNAVLGAELAFGQRARSVVKYDLAKVVVSVDCDFLGDETNLVRNQRSFAKTRAIESPSGEMSRLYVVEAGHSVTGANADHRLRLPASQAGEYLKALAKTLAGQGVDLSAVAGSLGNGQVAGVPAEWLTEVAKDLVANRGKSVVVVGRRQPAAVHALAYAINAALGNLGTTVQLFPAVDPSEGDVVASLKQLVDEIQQVETLVILGGNPVYDAPADLAFAQALGRQGLTTVHLSSRVNETSALCSWHCPEAHELEAWGDQKAVDGTVSIQQPLIAPLWHARSAIELLAMAAGVRAWRGYNVVRSTTRQTSLSQGLFERDWRKVLHRGVVDGTTAVALADLALNGAAVAGALAQVAAPVAVSAQAMEVQFVADPKLFDGRHANNLWALELPDPMTKLVWDNAALVSRGTRDALGVRDGDVLRLSRSGKQIEVPVFALAGHADNCITLALGWGRTEAGRYGNGKGFDVQALRTVDGFHFATGVSVAKANRQYVLVQTQEHDRMEGRPIAIDSDLATYKDDPTFAQQRSVDPVAVSPLWRQVDYAGRHKWGMVVDLSSCTGCNACVIACQSENNIPTVGKLEVQRGREMYWMRIDRYFVGDDDANPGVAVQPITCQHCEEAPCENVCPVNATAHTPEGLNDMAYNRCIGTRYCANNCPYKVRRFNYLDWHTVLDEYTQNDQAALAARGATAVPHSFQTYGDFPHERRMQFNPNVTVRMRGVIEKCSYCVQRIQEAKIASRREHRAMRDGDVVTACQQACASGAIAFGDLNDAQSRVAQLASRDRRYKLLAEVGAQPRTTFLAKIRNPNPAMGGAHAHAGAEEAHQ